MTTQYDEDDKYDLDPINQQNKGNEKKALLDDKPKEEEGEEEEEEVIEQKPSLFSKIFPFLLYGVALLIAATLIISLIIAQLFEAPVQHFIVIGNYGRKGTDQQNSTALGIETYCENHQCGKFIISTGVNFFPNGVSSVIDPHFNESYEWVYNGSNTKNMEFHTVLGENDYYQNPSYLIEYTKLNKTVPSKWKMFDYFYNMEKESETAFGNKIKNKFIMLDTTPMVYLNNHSNSHLNNTHLKERDPENQFKWLKDELNDLNNKNFSWIFIVGHHGAYSSREDYEKNSILENVYKNLKDDQIVVYLCGGDKFISYGRSLTYKNVYQVNSGAASLTDPVTVAPGLEIYQTKQDSFVHFTVYKDKIFIAVVNTKGEKVDEYEIFKN